jgi:tetratricopeptide (TPR) repeat protein
MVQLVRSALPSPQDPDFGQRIRRLDMTLDRPERDFRSVLADQTASRSERFACLYGLLTRLRREYRFREYRDLVRESEAEFGSEPRFVEFRVVLARWTGDDARGLRSAIEPSERAVALLPSDPGVLHQYSELIASLGEIDPVAVRSYMEKAFDRVSTAIDLAPDRNANYYSTRARLFNLKGDLESARADISHAIASEDTRSPDYVRRISRYESIRFVIVARQQQLDMESKQHAVLAELDQFKAQQLSMLGLLAALIALLAVTASIATRVSADQAIRLITASGGVIVVAFVAVTAALIGSPIRKVALTLGIGIALLLTGILMT